MTSDYFVSPKHRASAQKPGDLNGAIRVFKAAVQGWMLDHAKSLTRSRYEHREHAGFAVLMLVSSYFEAIEPYFPGSTATKPHEKWRAGFRRVFPELAGIPDSHIDRVYGEVRCGLYHSLSTGSYIQIAWRGPAIDIISDSAGVFAGAAINPRQVLTRIEAHFKRYISDLKNTNNTTLRQAFATRHRVGVAHPAVHSVGARSSWP